ncbi:MAG: TMEM165/GDT1 family protein [Candidatus Hodarchaeota archaeon]
MTLIDLVQAFLLSLSAIFIMEMGDKTQLAAFTLSMKYRSLGKVFLGVICGLTGVTIIAIIIGILMRTTLGIDFLKPIIGILFILGGVFVLGSKLRKKNEELTRICPVSMELCKKPHDNCSEIDDCKIYLKEVTQKGAFIGSFTFMFLAELGDKTMLMGAGLATQFDPVGVFLGAILALVLVNGIGVFAGEKIAQKIPRGKIEVLSGLLFIIIGVIILFV